MLVSVVTCFVPCHGGSWIGSLVVPPPYDAARWQQIWDTVKMAVWNKLSEPGVPSTGQWSAYLETSLEQPGNRLEPFMRWFRQSIGFRPVVEWRWEPEMPVDHPWTPAGEDILYGK